MIIPVANKCLQCKRIFCCPSCRHKHELKEHVVQPESAAATASCTLCNAQPFRLQATHSAPLLAHIAATHLPLQCSRCTTQFASATDLQLAVTCCQQVGQQPGDRSAARRRPQIPPLTDKYGRILKMPTTTASAKQQSDGQPSTANCSLKSIASTATYVNQPHNGLTGHMGGAAAAELAGTSTVTTVAAADLSHATTSDQHLTPITQWNMRWRLKLGGVSGGGGEGLGANSAVSGLGGSAANASANGGGAYTDSISSIRNVSSMLNHTPSMLLSHSENSPQQQLGGAHREQGSMQHLAAHPHRHQQQHHHQQQQHPKHPSLKRQTSTPMHHGGMQHHHQQQQQQHYHHHHHPSQHYPYYASNHLGPKRAHSFESLSSSSCQMSSIGGHNFSSDSDMSPPVCSSSRVAHAATKPTVAALNQSQQQQQQQRPRHKLNPSATPLRQVMSRSIQKAIVQHGMSKFVMTNHGRYSPAAAAAATAGLPPPSPAAAPLDLRTSPAIRRSFETGSTDGDSSGSSAGSSAGSSVASISPPASHRQIMRHDRRRILGDESAATGGRRVESIAEVDVNNNVDSVYESCKSYDVVNDTTGLQDAVAAAADTLQQTPKIVGLAIRANSFAERRAAPRPSCYEPRPMDEDDVRVAEETDAPGVEPAMAEVAKAVLEETVASGEPDDDEVDVWYTPPVKLHKAASCPAWKIPAFTLRDISQPDSAEKTPIDNSKLFRLSSQRSSESDDNVFSSTKRSHQAGTPPRSARKTRINSARIESVYPREKSVHKPSPYGVQKRRALVRTPVLKKLKSKVVEAGASGIWSKVATGLMRLASFGQTVDEVASPPALIQPSWNDFKSPRPIETTNTVLLKKCATFGGVSLSQTVDSRRAGDEEMLKSLTLCGKRRRTLTNSQSSLSPNQTGRLPAHRISGRPPLKRMRRIGGSLVSPI